MKTPVVLRIGAVGAAAVCVAVFGSGVAAADPLIGKTYAEASALIGQWGVTPVVSTVVGSNLPTDECLVTHWAESGSKVLVSLNCNGKLAEPGNPGNSAASLQGREMKELHDTADFIDEHPEWCEKNADQCLNFCSRHEGMCSTY